MSDFPGRPMVAAVCAIVIGAATGVAISVTVTGWPSDARQMLDIAAFVAVPIAAFHALLVGAPLYALARRRWPLTWLNAMLGGAMTAIVPAASWFLISLPGAIADGDFGAMLRVTGAALVWLGAAGAAAGLGYRAVRGALPVATV